MARYYCEYCHSYLTHDTLSVRKSHLIGKNHLRITADYYRNKHICSLRPKKSPITSAKKTVSNKKSKHEQKKIGTFHPLSNKEKRSNRNLQRIIDKEIDINYQRRVEEQKGSRSKTLNPRNSIYKQDTILSQLYEGSPGYSKIFIQSNRFDIGDTIKQSRLPQRANVNSGDNRGYAPVSIRKRDRNEVYLNLPEASFDLPPPMTLSNWQTNIPRYQIYNNSKDNRERTVTTQTTLPTNIHHSNGFRDGRKRYISEDHGNYKRRKY